MKEWKLDHPQLSQDQISEIHATAERLKDQLANPPPPEPRVTVPVTKPTDLPLPGVQGLGKFVSNSTRGPSGVNSTSTLDRALQIVRQAQCESRKEVDPEGMADCLKNSDVFWRNYPALKKDFKLQDPSDIIKRVYDNTTRLVDETELQMTMAENYLVAWDELASTLVLPAMSMSAAVQNMEGIVKIANQKIEQDRQEAIAAIISAVFFFIPIVGEAASLIGGTILRTIIELAGAFADVGYSIYDTVKHPDNLLSNLFGIIFAAGSMRSAFKEASAEWRVIKADKIDKLPKPFVRDVKSMRTMRGVCKL